MGGSGLFAGHRHVFTGYGGNERTGPSHNSGFGQDNAAGGPNRPTFDAQRNARGRWRVQPGGHFRSHRHAAKGEYGDPGHYFISKGHQDAAVHDVPVTDIMLVGGVIKPNQITIDLKAQPEAVGIVFTADQTPMGPWERAANFSTWIECPMVGNG